MSDSAAPLTLGDLLEVCSLVPALQGVTRIDPLGGGITNRTVLVHAGDEPYVLRVGGDDAYLLGIDRSAEYTCTLAAGAAGIAPPLVAYLPEHDVLVTRFARGRTMSGTALADLDTLRRVAAILRRIHSLPPVSCRFSPFDTVRSYYTEAIARGVVVPQRVENAIALLEAVERAALRDDPPVLCHNDLVPLNMLDDGECITIIDWEYAGMGDRFFDLGNIAANYNLEEAGEMALLHAYFAFVDEDHLLRLRLMRLASDMRDALWGYLQDRISTLEVDFIAYAEGQLDRFLLRVETIGPLLINIRTA